MMFYRMTRYFETGHVPRRKHRTTTAGVFAFVDRDGQPFILHLSSPDKFWNALFRVVGKPEWIDDERFNNRKGRIANYDTLSKEMQAVFACGQRDAWLKELIENDVPAAPLNTLDEVFKDPQVREYGFPVDVVHPKMGKVRMVGNAIDMSRTPPTIDRPPPVLGEHSNEILTSLGYNKMRLAEFKRKGII